MSETAIPSLDPFTLLQTVSRLAAPAPTLNEIGTVTEVGDGIVVVAGLTRARADEMLMFESGVKGIVLDLDTDRLGVVLLGSSEQVRVGDDVKRAHRVVSVPVGDRLLGRVVDALGQPLDEGRPVIAASIRPVECEAPTILQRTSITHPLATGVTVIDAAVPIGLGQRELIIGDRQTGKTSIAIDAILNQHDTELVCLYCAIGQRGDAVAKVIEALKAGNMMSRTIVIAAGDEDPPGLAYIAPFAAMSMAEHFAHQGQDVLLVMDDLTHHARNYRELSLLLRRPPGREAFPGDVFYLHARLLERAGQFASSIGGGSITALPIIETQAENLSAYIPTNLISITDGQIYLTPRLVRKNQFPAVDLGVSVSRVGGKAQSPLYREASGNLRVVLSQFEELEDFARFGTRLDDDTRARLIRGNAVRAALRQPERAPIPTVSQVVVLIAAMEGLFDASPDATRDMAAVSAAAVSELDVLQQRIASNAPLTDKDRSHIIDVARNALLIDHEQS